jgi:hypothetical protein
MIQNPVYLLNYAHLDVKTTYVTLYVELQKRVLEGRDVHETQQTNLKHG